MVVFLTGQTGVENSLVTESLRRKAIEDKGLTLGKDIKLDQSVIRVFNVEDFIIKEMGAPHLKPFLDSLSPFYREVIWERAVDKIANKVAQLRKSNNSPIIVISFHLVFFRDNEYLNCINPKKLTAFDPEVIITLIDDCYDIVFRVEEKREKQGIRTRTKLGIADALSWRSAEIMVAGLVAKMSSTIPMHFVVPVKHSMDMLYDLLFAQEKLRIYASYPITKLRLNSNCLSEIASFLEFLEKHYIVFNPATIDEYRSGDKNAQRLPLNNRMVAPEGDYFGEYYEDIKKLENVIADQIASRDYLLVRQSEIVVAYRPFWNGELSDGVEKEIVHALTEGKEVLVFSPPEDHEQVSNKQIFKIVQKAALFTDLEELRKNLVLLQEKKSTNFRV